MRRTKVSAVVRQRQQHYRSWLEAIAQLPNARALFSEIASNSAPYMFPLLISRPDTQFYSLKHSGVPIWRWDEMAVSACPVAAQYRLHLLHLPCHQSLSAEQMQWMISVIAKALS
jgi:dTDP-4-amino-4,6-dideoxygalactose transaminase